MKTAVELFKLRLIQRGIGFNQKDFEEAKEMESKQAQEYAEFAIRCDREDMKILDFDGYMNLKTFKSE
jgi:hypothetical protein